MYSMKITPPVQAGGGWLKFDVNFRGFEIRGCTWHPATNKLRFPRRRKRPGSKIWLPVIRAPKGFVKQLKELLRSGQLETDRDRAPRVFRIFDLRNVGGWWYVFGFEIQRVQILWCRWNPEKGSIQFPITYLAGTGYKKRVVHAKGPHVTRLREALERYAVKKGVIPEELLAAFKRDIQERRKELAKAA
jgi:hypothetical protein